MHETEAGFNTNIVVKELLDLLVKKKVLKKKDVDKLLQSAKTHFNEVPEEPDITWLTWFQKNFLFSIEKPFDSRY